MGIGLLLHPLSDSRSNTERKSTLPEGVGVAHQHVEQCQLLEPTPEAYMKDNIAVYATTECVHMQDNFRQGRLPRSINKSNVCTKLPPL